jgi:hypothetical protein
MKPSIKEFIDIVSNNLSKQDYPKGYKLGKHWKTHVEENLLVANQIAIEMPDDNQAAYFFNKVRRDANSRDPGFDHNDHEPVNYYNRIVNSAGHRNFNTIIETGTGFGNTARIFHIRQANSCYVLVDLPENLIYSYAFINMHFPDAKIDIVLDKEFRFNLCDFIFCPIQQLSNLNIPNVDLYLNTYSLGEMPQPSIDHVLKHIQRLKPKYIYSENIMFANKKYLYDAGREDSSEIVLNLQPQWLPLLFEFNWQIMEVHRYIVSALLERVELPVELLIEALLAERNRTEKDWIKDYYFAALYDKQYTDKFLDILERYNINSGCLNTPNYDFNKIGEVIWFRRRLGQ